MGAQQQGHLPLLHLGVLHRVMEPGSLSRAGGWLGGWQGGTSRTPANGFSSGASSLDTHTHSLTPGTSHRSRWRQWTWVPAGEHTAGPRHTLTLTLSRFSHVRLFATPWTVACQAPLSMGLFKQEYWSGLPCPPTRDLPNLGIEPTSPTAAA